ncbi:MAG: PAS domain S-box protein, partial [Pseudomonadota bacterium]|nr:PAS domain S-box protein [Pseudomonadota bacterium]
LELELSRHALDETNRQKSAILASSDHMIIATDMAGNIQTFNTSAERSLGYTAAEVTGKLTPLAWQDPKEIEQRAKELTEILNKPIEKGFEVLSAIAAIRGGEEREWTYIHKNGRRFPVRITVNVLRDQQNDIRGYLCIIKDITREREDIKQREMVAENLRQSEQTFRAAMENASIGMALVGLDGRWLKVNPALCDLLGYNKEEFLKTNFQSITHPEDLPADLENNRKVLAGEVQTYQMEKRYFHKHGRLIWALLNVSLVRRQDGVPSYFIAQIQDITERKEMDRMKGEFISIVSHELRTPLTSIRGSLGLIAGAMAKDLPEKVANLVNIAHKNSERLILLINDILDIDKIAAGQMRFDIKSEKLAPLMRQAIEANRAYAEKFGIEIKLEPVSDLITLETDANRFGQVMTNLISNAAKFSPRGSAVTVAALSENGKIRISVTDHGPGIPEEFRPRIFSKFSQADSSATREKGGTGLGLHITKQIVDYMGGIIGFDTVTGQGSTFWIDFPNRPRPAEKVRQAGHLSSTRKAYRVLICDDDEDIVAILKLQMEHAGFETDTAYSIAEAREKLTRNTYIAMTLDLAFPVGNGLEFIRELRDNPKTVSLPIVVVSANVGAGKGKLMGDAFGVVDWLKKPLDAKQLIEALERAARPQTGTPRVLHIEDDQDLSNMLATALSTKTELINARSIREAKERLARETFSLVILDVALPDGNGLGLLADMNDHAPPIPVLILSASEIPLEVHHQVAAAMVKARMSETKIVETILSLIYSPGPDAPINHRH